MADSQVTATPMIFETELASTSQDVRGALDSVSGVLGLSGWNAAACGVVELVLAEALNNIVEHAYRDCPDGHIVLRLRAGAEFADLTLHDRGSAMPDFRLPAGRFVDVGVRCEDLPEGGFGWYLIRTLAEDICYTRENDRNRLELRICRHTHDDFHGAENPRR